MGSNWVNNDRKKRSVSEFEKKEKRDRAMASKRIKVTLDENRQVSWFLDYILYEKEKKKYTQEFVDKLKKMSYKMYLMTPHWGRVRRAVYGKFGRCCFACSSTEKEIHVHHLTYENRGMENMEDLMLLCKGCHEMAHEIMKRCDESEREYKNPYTD